MSSSTLSNIKTITDIKREEYKNPHNKWSTDIENEIKLYIRYSLSIDDNVFDKIIERIEAYYDKPCINMLQLRKCTKQESGNMWEHFCVMYLRAKGYGECWLLGNTPEEILKELNLTRKDYGIDIIVKHDNGYFAVQAKWRSNPHRKKTISLTWKQLSTFYALCARTGPWLKYIVMTNCNSVKRMGKKWKMDQTIAKAGFKSCKRYIWQNIAGIHEGFSLLEKNNIIEKIKDVQDSNQEENISIIQRNQRLAFLDKLTNK